MNRVLIVCFGVLATLELCAQHVKNAELPAPLKNTKEQILRRKGYTVSYNKDLKIPNWVAWHLTAEHVNGTVERFKSYLEDEDVPKPRATNDDYRGSGWSHGHMCPADDNKWDEQAMRETFLLTNMCPQDRDFFGEDFYLHTYTFHFTALVVRKLRDFLPTLNLHNPTLSPKSVEFYCTFTQQRCYLLGVSGIVAGGKQHSCSRKVASLIN